MVAIKNLLFCAAAASALVVEKRATVDTINNDIASIKKATNGYITTVNNYNGGIFNAIPIVDAEKYLDGNITHASDDVPASPKLSSADSNSIISNVNNLIPTIETALKDTENKKPQFDQDGLSSTVLKDLKQLKSDTDTFASKLVAVASDDTTTQAQDLKSKIDSDFQAAIDYFS